jgi:choline dehydrogenase
VLLVEAGGPATLRAIADPPDWPELQGSSVDWRYATIPQPGLGGRIVPYPRGKVIGGSSAINALAYQIMCLSLPFVLPSVGPLAPPAYVLVPCLMRPRSRGSVKLASSDPRATALIDPNYLAEPVDLDILMQGAGLAREIGAVAAFADWRAEEIYPGSSAVSTADLRNFVLRAANSFHHPVGTCRIDSVVDEALRVKGIEGLRVIDASVIPEIPQAMINATTTAIAERASDLLLAG